MSNRGGDEKGSREAKLVRSRPTVCVYQQVSYEVASNTRKALCRLSRVSSTCFCLRGCSVHLEVARCGVVACPLCWRGDAW